MEPMKKQLLVFTVIVVLLAGAIVALFSVSDIEQSSFKYTEEGTSGEGQFLSEESVESWLQYDGEVQGEELELISPQIEPLTEDELEEIKSGISNGTGTYASEGTSRPGAGGEESALGEEQDKSAEDNGAEERGVEEGDIVKLSQDRLYILSRYRGFVVVDVADPEDLRMISHLNLKGHPVEMYVHPPLVVVVLYGTYYRTPSTLVAVLKLKDEGDVRVVKYITVEGRAAVSRLVGDTLYVATLLHPYYYPAYGVGVRGEVAVGEASFEEVDGYYYNKPEQAVLVSSIDLSSPERLGVVDNLTLRGESVQVHATSRAIFVATGYSRWMEESGEYIERTTVHYVDISDPHGKIKLRDGITFVGSLWDKYQMDYYGGTLRVITHRNSWREQGTSYLSIIDVRDPDNLKVMGGLSVDEAGNLMAVRFAEKRLYLIHLPEAPDPLRVVDLTDPTQPELKSVLEIPGWVEHMEVIGNHIVAVGVNNTEGFRVSIYLFNVSDPDNPILLDTLSVGKGHSSSEALWEPKAITLLPERSLLVIPYTEYFWPQEDKGLIFVKYSLEEGKLSLWGKVSTPDVLRRSRVKGDYVLGTAERLCISVDISGDSPRLASVLPLTENYYSLLSLPGGVGALVDVLGEHYFRYIPRGGTATQVRLPMNTSVEWWQVSAFSRGVRVLLVWTDIYYWYHGCYREDYRGQTPTTTLVLVEVDGSVPRVRDTAELTGRVYQVQELSDGRVLLSKGTYYYPHEYEEYETGEEGGTDFYIVNYSSGEIDVEEVELEVEPYETLYPLESGLYTVKMELDYKGSGDVSSIYHIDLQNGSREAVGTLRGWVVTWEGSRMVTAFWNHESYQLDVYTVTPKSVVREATLTLPMWGDVLVRGNSLYFVSGYYPIFYLEGAASDEGLAYRGPQTAIMKIDIQSGEVLDAVKVEGIYWAMEITDEWILLSGYDQGTSLVGALSTANLTQNAFRAVLTAPLDAVVDGDILHLALGEFGYSAVELDVGD